MTVAIDDDSTPRRSIALMVTIVFHGLLLLFFILYKIITPIPPFPEKDGGGSGYELALGFTELGMGDNSNAVDPSTPAAQQESAPPPAEEAEVLTSEVDENNVTAPPKPVDKPKTDKPKTDKPKLTEEEIRRNKQREIDALMNNKGEGSSGKGASDTPGSAGGPNGTPNGNGQGNGQGSYKGNGFTIDLAGRKPGKPPHISEKPGVAGKVVLDIVVDVDGIVVSAELNMHKSTTLTQNLVSLARRAALESTFDKRTSGSGDQRGTMTFVFVLD